MFVFVWVVGGMAEPLTLRLTDIPYHMFMWQNVAPDFQMELANTTRQILMSMKLVLR